MNTQGESQLEVAKALYKRLHDATASGQPLEGITVHDSVPQGTAYPYIVIGEFMPSDYSDKSSAGMDIMCQIHVWSQKPTSRELKSIAAAIYGLLHNVPLTGMTGQINYLLRFLDGIGLQTESDNITRHEVLKYRILTTATA